MVRNNIMKLFSAMPSLESFKKCIKDIISKVRDAFSSNIDKIQFFLIALIACLFIIYIGISFSHPKNPSDNEKYIQLKNAMIDNIINPSNAKIDLSSNRNLTVIIPDTCMFPKDIEYMISDYVIYIFNVMYLMKTGEESSDKYKKIIAMRTKEASSIKHAITNESVLDLYKCKIYISDMDYCINNNIYGDCDLKLYHNSVITHINGPISKGFVNAYLNLCAYYDGSKDSASISVMKNLKDFWFLKIMRSLIYNKNHYRAHRAYSTHSTNSTNSTHKNGSNMRKEYEDGLDRDIGMVYRYIRNNMRMFSGHATPLITQRGDFMSLHETFKHLLKSATSINPKNIAGYDSLHKDKIHSLMRKYNDRHSDKYVISLYQKDLAIYMHKALDMGHTYVHELIRHFRDSTGTSTYNIITPVLLKEYIDSDGGDGAIFVDVLGCDYNYDINYVFRLLRDSVTIADYKNMIMDMD